LVLEKELCTMGSWKDGNRYFIKQIPKLSKILWNTNVKYGKTGG
jgi:hypothetical protein